nr:FCD domain-containing protein [Gordonia sp. SID5947]
MIIPPRRTSELVVDRMRDLIRSGEWAVGGRIPAEPELVEQFGVGRNTIREAVRALEHAGMLVPRRGDGTYVRSRNLLAAAIESCVPGSAHHDLLGARRAIEVEAAAAAAERASAAEVAGLRDRLRAAEQAFADADVSAYAQEDMAFHISLVAISGNRLLLELYDGIVEVMQRLHQHVVAATLTDGVHPSGHVAVVDAIEAGDPGAARAAVHSYLDEALRGMS